MERLKKRLKTVVLHLKSAKFNLKDSARLLLGKREGHEPEEVRVCPKCSEKNDALAIRCKACSEALPRRPIAPSSPPSAPPVAHREVISCPNCRAGMPPGTSRCALCGASLSKAAGESRGFPRAIKWVLGGALAILVLLLLLDFTVLKGTIVYRQMEARFPESQVINVKVPVDSAGVRYWLLLRTPHDLLAIMWEVCDPEGQNVCTGHDTDRRGGWRRSSFVPQTIGDYTIRVRPKEGAYAYDTDWVDVNVVRNEHQVLWPSIRGIF